MSANKNFKKIVYKAKSYGPAGSSSTVYAPVWQEVLDPPKRDSIPFDFDALREARRKVEMKRAFGRRLYLSLKVALSSALARFLGLEDPQSP